MKTGLKLDCDLHFLQVAFFVLLLQRNFNVEEIINDKRLSFLFNFFKTTMTMNNEVNRAQGAKKKQNYLCVDLQTQMKENDLQVSNQAKGTLLRDGEDHFVFTENEGKPHVAHPELHWRLLDRTKHGRVHVNANHVKVEFYIHHTDYADGRDLADLLAREIETMGENLSETDMQAEVNKCC